MGVPETKQVDRATFLAEMEVLFKDQGGYQAFLKKLEGANLQSPDTYEDCGKPEGKDFTRLVSHSGGQFVYSLNPKLYDQYTSTERFQKGEHSSVVWTKDGDEVRAYTLFNGAGILYIDEVSSFGNMDDSRWLDAKSRYGNLTFVIYPTKSSSPIGLSDSREIKNSKFFALLSEWQKNKKALEDSDFRALGIPHRPWDVRGEKRVGALRFVFGPVKSSEPPNKDSNPNGNMMCEWPKEQWTRAQYLDGLPVVDMDDTPGFKDVRYFQIWLSEGESPQQTTAAFAVIDLELLKKYGEVTLAEHPTNSRESIVQYGPEGRKLHKEAPSAITIRLK